MKLLKILGFAAGALMAVLLLVVIGIYVSFDGPRLKAEAARVVLERYQRTLSIDGHVTLSLWPNIGVNLGKLTLSERNSADEFAHIDSLRVAVAVMPLLSHRLDIREVDIDGLRLNLSKNKKGQLNVADLLTGDPVPAAPAASSGVGINLPALDVRGVRIANANVLWRDDTSNTTQQLSHLNLSSGRIHADASADRLLAEAITLTTAVAGKGWQGTAALGVKDVIGQPGSIKVAELITDLALTAGGTEVLMYLASPVSVDRAARTLTLEKLGGSLSVKHPDLPKHNLTLPLDGVLNADFTHQNARLTLKTGIDESTLKLDLAAKKLAPLQLAAIIDVDRFDLDRYLPPPAVPDNELAKPGKPAPADAKIDLSALKSLDLAIKLNVGQLQVRRLKLAALDLGLTARDGTLVLAPLRAQLYEGSLDGTGSLKVNGNRIALKQKLTGVNIAPLLTDLTGKTAIEGRGTVIADLSTQGASLTEFKQGLAGEVGIKLRDGAIKGINLARSLRGIKATLSAAQSADGSAETANDAHEKTDFSEAMAGFRIVDGVARNDDLILKAPLLRVGGAGQIDLVRGEIDYLIKASVVNTSKGQDGRELDHLKGLTIPVRLSGPLEAPAWKIDLSAMIAQSAKARVDKTKGALKEKLSDQLKGLLGR